jgi:hypothetical protein
MQENKTTVEFHKDKTDILIVAPHAVKNDDDNTEAIAFNMTAELECRSLINNKIKRGEGNYNSQTDATEDAVFISNIRSVLDAPGSTMVAWIMGFDPVID